MEYKTCSICKENLPIDNFNKDSNRSSGYYVYCRKCTQDKYISKLNYERTTEPQKCSVCKIMKPSENYSLDKKRKNGIHANCKECLYKREVERKYKNVNNFILDLYRNSFQRSKKSKVPFNLTVDEWIDIYNTQQGKCALTGVEMTFLYKPGRNFETNISPDQKIPKAGYTKENLHFVCWYVNQAKNDLNIDTFIEMCRRVANFNTPT
jgi:hypothetical protein